MPPRIEAAGVVLLRTARGRGLQVCLVHRPRRSDWSLPKGKRDPGEMLPVTARRETIEETGVEVALGAPLHQQRYKVDGRPKTVDYWVGRALRGGPGFRPNKEIDDLAWMSPKQARARLTYPRDRELIDEAIAHGHSSPLIILRHTQAMKRADFKGKVDARRPVTRVGRTQAKSLVGLLTAFGIHDVRSSDATRCLQSVAPTADRLGVRVGEEPLFSEEGFEDSPKAALRRLLVIARRPAATVLCTHRPVLPSVLECLADYYGLKASAPLLDPSLQPGGAIILHRALSDRGRPQRRLLAAERYDG